MKNRLIIILITLILPLSVFAIDEQVVPIDEPVYLEHTKDVSDELQPQETEDIQSISLEQETTSAAIKEEENPMPYKQPISKRKLIKKFLLAMFAVGASSLVLYFGLTLYNKFRDNPVVQIKTPDGKTPLSEPQDIEGAVDIFLDKTKWV